jgi:hypothetical protein
LKVVSSYDGSDVDVSDGVGNVVVVECDGQMMVMTVMVMTVVVSRVWTL